MLHINNLKMPKFNLKNTAELTIVRFFFVISIAFFETIWAVYMKSFGLSDSTIGYISGILVLISLIFIFYCVNILEKLSDYASFVVGSILIIVSLILIGYFQSLYLVLSLILVLSLSNILRMNSFSILFRDTIPEGKLNGSEALLSVIGNIGWFIGPIVAGLLFKVYGFSYIFYLGAFFSLISLLMFFKIPLKKKVCKTFTKKSFKFLFSNFVKKTEIKLPYIMSMGISLWWGFIFLYIPLFILDAGLPKEYIGFFIGLTQLPLIFFEYFSGKGSEKYGFRYFFTIGFLGLAIISIICFYLSNIYITLTLLILASFFVSLIEPLRYSYIFSKIKKSDEEDIIPLFSSSLSLGSLIGKMSIASLLLFLPNNYSYLLIGFMMFSLSLIAYYKIKK